MRVLIVDDNPATRFLLRDAIESEGHAVVAETETFESTVAAYAEHKPDVVTLDITLADCDGLSVLKALRAKDPKVKVLVISGNAQKKISDMFIVAGARDFLAKPFQLKDVVPALERAAK